MRTTVTLDPDVEALLRKAMRDRGLSFKEALNQAIRAGLAQRQARRGRAPLKLRTYHMGFSPSIRRDKALAVAAEIEDLEIAHKLPLRK
jgi:hypothetical protein